MLNLLTALVCLPQDPSRLLTALRGPDAGAAAVAAKELEALGQPALEQLRALRSEVKDTEVRSRVDHVIGGYRVGASRRTAAGVHARQ